MRFPDPVISVSVEPKTRADVDKMSTALYKMVKADPSLRLEVDQETGPDRSCAAWASCTSRSPSTACAPSSASRPTWARPRVSFREAFGTTVEHVYTHKKQSGGSGQYAEVKMVFEPLRGGHRRGVLRRGRRRPHPARVHPVGRARDRHRVQARPGRRLRGRRLQGAPARRQVPRRRLARRWRSRSRAAPASARRTGRAGRSCSSRS